MLPYQFSLTRWTWVWVNFGSWWWIGRPGVLQFMRLQTVGHDWETELNWTEVDCKEIKPANPKGNQPWIFIGRTDAEVEAPILRPPDAKSQLIGKDPDAGKDWRQEERGTTENEMVGWHHWLSEHEFEYSLGHSEGQGTLTWSSLWCHKEVDRTEQLNKITVRSSPYRL